MSPLQLAPIDQDGFRFSAALEQQTIRAVLGGTAELKAQEPLKDALTKLHAEALRLAVTEVVADLRGLEFMNSSCFKSFVTWLSRVDDQPNERRYKIRFVSNPKIRWQRASLHALSCFAVDLVQIETMA